MTYVAIVAEVHPQRVGDMLAYLRLIVREAGKFGGNGWLTYDSVFLRNQEGLSTPWNMLDVSLHQVYIAKKGGKHYNTLQALPGSGPRVGGLCDHCSFTPGH